MDIILYDNNSLENVINSYLEYKKGLENSKLLSKTFKEIFQDKNVDCVFGHQKARKNAFLVVKKDYERAFGDGSISKNWDRFFSLVSSGFRKEDLINKPFNENIQYSEDSEWVNSNKANIVYVQDAIVVHSHNYTLKEVKKRFFNEGVADRQMGKKPISIFCASKNFLAETIRDYCYIIKQKDFRKLYYPVIYRFVQKFSYYRGTQQ